MIHSLTFLSLHDWLIIKFPDVVINLSDGVFFSNLKICLGIFSSAFKWKVLRFPFILLFFSFAFFFLYIFLSHLTYFFRWICFIPFTFLFLSWSRSINLSLSCTSFIAYFIFPIFSFLSFSIPLLPSYYIYIFILPSSRSSFPSHSPHFPMHTERIWKTLHHWLCLRRRSGLVTCAGTWGGTGGR